MRIIAGSLKGRRLEGPLKGVLEVRPTSDRAREALFSILLRWPMGTFVDLFAGTGAVALEAHSRGFGPVVCVEAKPRPFLHRNLELGGVSLVAKDTAKLGPDAFRGVAVIFADAPYERSVELWIKLAPLMHAWLAESGVLTWETDARTELPTQAGWRLVEARQYGTARFHFMERA